MDNVFMGKIVGSCSRISEEDGKILLKDRDALKEKVEKLEAELMEIKTARTLREAYISGVEKGCEGLREERDRWKSRWNSVVTDIGELLKANGIEFTLKEVDGNGNWDFVIDIPELNEAKKKVEELEKRVVALEKTNNNLNQKIGAADNALEYWNNTYNDIVIAGKKVGVNIDIKGKRPDSNAGFVYVTNQKALELLWQNNYDKKWQAMLEALKAKGVEVIYMGEEDGKPIVDVKIPEIDILKKELETLKSRTLDNVEIRLSCGDIVWTYCDGFVHVSSGISGMISADEISTGTIPKCKSCAHYMHNPSRFAHDWCYMPIPKEGGAGYIRKLSKEEAEGPACSDFKAKE